MTEKDTQLEAGLASDLNRELERLLSPRKYIKNNSK